MGSNLPPWEIDDTTDDASGRLAKYREQGPANAEFGAMMRSEATPDRLGGEGGASSIFRRTEEIPSEPPAPGAEGGPPARHGAMAVPLSMMAGPIAGGLGLGSVLPFLPRAGAAATGATQGYKRGGLPAALAGGALGAARPELVLGGTGLLEGAEDIAAGKPIQGVGEIALGAALGGKGKLLKRLLGLAGGAGKAKDATTIAREVNAARTASRVGKAVGGTEAAKQAAFKARSAAERGKDWAGLETEGAARAAATRATTSAPAVRSMITGGTAKTAPVEEIASQVSRWRSEQKFSDPQILAALRNVYGIPEAMGKQVLTILQ